MRSLARPSGEGRRATGDGNSMLEERQARTVFSCSRVFWKRNAYKFGGVVLGIQYAAAGRPPARFFVCTDEGKFRRLDSLGEPIKHGLLNNVLL